MTTKMAADWAEGSLIINVNLWLLIINGYNKRATNLTHTTLQKFLDMKLTDQSTISRKKHKQNGKPKNFVLATRRRELS